MRLSPRIVFLGLIGLTFVSATVAVISNRVQAPSDEDSTSNLNQTQPTPRKDTLKKVNHLSTTFNYELEIPASWGEVAHSSEYYYLKQYRAPDGSRLEIIVYEDQDNLTTFITERDLQSQTAYEGYPSIEVLEETSVTVAGYPGITRVEDRIPAGFTVRSTYLTVDNNTYSFTIYPSDQAMTELDNSVVGVYYDQVINSFKVR